MTVWVETDGTVYWSTAENAIPTHGDGANRNDNKYIDNSKTYRSVIRTNSIGVEFVGNFPDVAKPATREQAQAWLILVRFLQERYDIPAENIYAHNWIDFKDRRYCEGCDLATLARKLAYEPGKQRGEGDGSERSVERMPGCGAPAAASWWLRAASKICGSRFHPGYATAERIGRGASLVSSDRTPMPPWSCSPAGRIRRSAWPGRSSASRASRPSASTTASAIAPSSMRGRACAST